jgi:hypothetical protein
VFDLHFKPFILEDPSSQHQWQIQLQIGQTAKCAIAKVKTLNIKTLTGIRSVLFAAIPTIAVLGVAAII